MANEEADSIPTNPSPLPAEKFKRITKKCCCEDPELQITEFPETMKKEDLEKALQQHQRARKFAEVKSEFEKFFLNFWFD